MRRDPSRSPINIYFKENGILRLFVKLFLTVYIFNEDSFYSHRGQRHA